MHAGEAGELGGWFCGVGRRLSPSKGHTESDVIMVAAWLDTCLFPIPLAPSLSLWLPGPPCPLVARLLWLSFSVDSSQIPGKIGWGFNFVSPPLLPFPPFPISPPPSPSPSPSFPPSPIPLLSPFLFSLLSNIFFLRLAFKQE